MFNPVVFLLVCHLFNFLTALRSKIGCANFLLWSRDLKFVFVCTAARRKVVLANKFKINLIFYFSYSGNQVSTMKQTGKASPWMQFEDELVDLWNSSQCHNNKVQLCLANFGWCLALCAVMLLLFCHPFYTQNGSNDSKLNPNPVWEVFQFF